MRSRTHRIARASCAAASLLLLAAYGLPVERPHPSPCTHGPGGILPTSLPVVDQDFRMMARRVRDRLAADAAHRVATGRGVRVAVLDGGFDLTHPAIRAHLDAARYDGLDEDHDPHDVGNGRDDDGDGTPDRAVGHGTFVASMVLTAAPAAMIVPIRVRDDEGWGPVAALERGLRFARRSGVDVVNLSVSLGGEDAQALLAQVDALHADGIAVIVAAGNDGSRRLSPLAARPSTLAVAAVDVRDRLAAFSDRAPPGAVGRARMLCAPGVDLFGALVDGRHGYWSGTSFAAGLVSGAAALLREREPGLNAAAGYERLLGATQPVRGGCGRLGRVDLARLVTRRAVGR